MYDIFAPFPVTSPMSWSSRDNLTVALGPHIFNHNFSTETDKEIMCYHDDMDEISDITALAWDPTGQYLVIASEFGFVLVSRIIFSKYTIHVYI